MESSNSEPSSSSSSSRMPPPPFSEPGAPSSLSALSPPKRLPLALAPPRPRRALCVARRPRPPRRRQPRWSVGGAATPLRLNHARSASWALGDDEEVAVRVRFVQILRARGDPLGRGVGAGPLPVRGDGALGHRRVRRHEEQVRVRRVRDARAPRARRQPPEQDRAHGLLLRAPLLRHAAVAGQPEDLVPTERVELVEGHAEVPELGRVVDVDFRAAALRERLPGPRGAHQQQRQGEHRRRVCRALVVLRASSVQRREDAPCSLSPLSVFLARLSSIGEPTTQRSRTSRSSRGATAATSPTPSSSRPARPSPRGSGSSSTRTRRRPSSRTSSASFTGSDRTSARGRWRPG